MRWGLLGAGGLGATGLARAKIAVLRLYLLTCTAQARRLAIDWPHHGVFLLHELTEVSNPLFFSAFPLYAPSHSL